MGPVVAGSHHLSLLRSRGGRRCAGCGAFRRWWAGTAASIDRVVPVGATVVNMSDHVRVGGPRFAQLDDDYKVWAAYQRAQLKKEKL